MNGNHLWNDRMTKGNTICPRPFHGGGIKISFAFGEGYSPSFEKNLNLLHQTRMSTLVEIGTMILDRRLK
jgi:hypothetical protein